MKSIWRIFASVWLTVVLAALVCITAAWGSILAVRYPGFFRALDTELLIPWLANVGPQYVRITLWIYVLVFLIFLFAVNTAVCTADRLYGIIQARKPWRSILPQMVHIGFLVALLGHGAGNVAGYKTAENVIFEGRATQVPNEEGLLVRLDGFESALGPTGQLESLKTTVTLLKDDAELLTGDITINGPLLYDGIAFYHMDNGSTPTGLVLDMEGESMDVPLGGSFRTRDGAGFALGEFYPDFALDAQGRGYSRSGNFKNPHVEVVSGDGERAYLDVLEPGSTVRLNGRIITLKDYVITPYVILQINRDPGIVLIIIGSVILVAGMLTLLLYKGERAELVRRAPGV